MLLQIGPSPPQGPQIENVTVSKSGQFQIMALEGSKRGIQLVNERNTCRDLEAGYVVVSDSIEILHQSAEAVAVPRDKHGPP